MIWSAASTDLVDRGGAGADLADGGRTTVIEIAPAAEAALDATRAPPGALSVVQEAAAVAAAAAVAVGAWEALFRKWVAGPLA